MAISGVGSSYGVYTAGALTSAASTPKTASASSASSASSTSSSAGPPIGGSSSALDYLVNYLKESPAKRMEDSWLAQHHLTEQQLAAMPPAQQEAVRKQMEADIKKKLQEQSGAPGANANVVA
jgi:hypothetical protein